MLCYDVFPLPLLTVSSLFLDYLNYFHKKGGPLFDFARVEHIIRT